MKLKIKNGKELEFNAGERLLDVLRNNGYSISADCGGNGICKKCKVKVVSGIITDKDGYCLSCKTVLTNDAEIEVDEKKGTGLLEFESVKLKSSGEKGFALAIDIGTTTLAYYFINLFNGQILFTKSELNNQKVFGADVISRIKACKEGKLKLLHEIIVQQINNTIKDICEKFFIKEIDKVFIAGNNTMLHLVYNKDPSSMGQYPYTPLFTETIFKEGKDFDIYSKEVFLAPSISAFVGGDIVVGAIAVDIEKGNNLLIDIGTNGEMLLHINNKLVCASTAAGPVFEGAKITCGIGGIAGAIDSVKIVNGKIEYTTIGNIPPIGICGTGLIDAVSVMLKLNIIDETGNFCSGDKFYISENVFISKKDIREFQLGKSAIKSGIITLINSIGKRYDDIDNLYIAGGLGYYINKENAVNVGLIPQELYSKIKVVGNTSGKGAIICLFDKNKLKQAKELSKKTESIDLSKEKEFMEEYIENMYF